MRVARLRKGDTLYRAGDLGTSAFVVLDGTLAHVFTDPASGTEVEVRCFTTPSVCVRVCVDVWSARGRRGCSCTACACAFARACVSLSLCKCLFR